MFTVRVKEWEKRNWKVVATFDTFKEAHKYAVALDFKWRKSIDTMYNSIDIKNTETKERFGIVLV